MQCYGSQDEVKKNASAWAWYNILISDDWSLRYLSMLLQLQRLHIRFNDKIFMQSRAADKKKHNKLKIYQNTNNSLILLL
jgi:hypothetical protein